MIELISSDKKSAETKSSNNKFNPMIIIIPAVCIFLLIKIFSRNETIESQYLKKGEVTYFDFKGELGSDRGLTFIAHENNVDFEIITVDGNRGRPWKNRDHRNNGTYIMKPHHRGVYIVSHNKDTQMNVSFKTIK